MKQIAISLFLVLTFSAGSGFVFRNILGFYEGATIAAILQIIIPLLYRRITATSQTINQLQLQADELIDLATISVKCPCGAHSFNEIIFVTELDGVRRQCPACLGTYKLTPTVDAIMVTESINNVSVTYDNLIEQKEH